MEKKLSLIAVVSILNAIEFDQMERKLNWLSPILNDFLLTIHFSNRSYGELGSHYIYKNGCKLANDSGHLRIQSDQSGGPTSPTIFEAIRTVLVRIFLQNKMKFYQFSRFRTAAALWYWFGCSPSDCVNAKWFFISHVYQNLWICTFLTISSAFEALNQRIRRPQKMNAIYSVVFGFFQMQKSSHLLFLRRRRY